MAAEEKESYVDHYHYRPNPELASLIRPKEKRKEASRAAAKNSSGSSTESQSEASGGNNDNDEQQQQPPPAKKRRPVIVQLEKGVVPKRVDFRKLKPRRQLREAVEQCQQTEMAVLTARQALQEAEDKWKDRWTHYEQLSRDIVDDLLEQEQIRPWNQWYGKLEAYQQNNPGVWPVQRERTNKKNRRKSNKRKIGETAETAGNESKQAEVGEEKEKEGGEEEDGEFLKAERRLGAWVIGQRVEHSKGMLERWKVTALDRLGMVWDEREANWHDNLEKLKAYKAQHGTAHVEDKHNKSLYRWVKHQIAKYKMWKSNGRISVPGMNQEMVDCLNAVGPEWRGLKESKWNRRFTKLQDLQASQGHLNTIPENQKDLIEFVKSQREAYKEYIANDGKDSDTMTTKRIQSLDSIGFPWTESLAKQRHMDRSSCNKLGN